MIERHESSICCGMIDLAHTEINDHQRLFFTCVLTQLTLKTLLMSAFILDFERVSGNKVKTSIQFPNNHDRDMSILLTPSLKPNSKPLSRK